VLPDVQGRIDHLDIDLAGKRLFVAALGNNSVEVVHLQAGRRNVRLDHLHEPQGVAYLPELKRLFVANGESGVVDVFSATTLLAVGHVDGLKDADNVRYTAADGLVYVGYGSALAVLDGATAKLVSRIELAGHPESFQLERSGTRIFVNVPSAGQVTVLDRRKGAVVATWKLDRKRANFPMALDENGRRLFIATREPAALLIYDTMDGKPVASVAIARDADDLFFDRQRKLLFAICGEGVIDVIRQQDADHYRSAGHVRTAPGARTGLWDATRGRLYVAVPARGAVPAEVRIYEANQSSPTVR
jgi:DNA-binding beta-propeller fold protein YncE